MTDDDTKFRRAMREAPTRWTAAIIREPQPTLDLESEAPVEGEQNPERRDPAQ